MRMNLLKSIRDINQRYWQECTGVHVLILLYSGFWELKPDEKNRYLRAVKILPYLGIITFPLCLVIGLYDIRLKFHSYILLAECLVYIITLTKALIRTAIATFFQTEIAGMINRAEQFMSIVVNEKERGIFKKNNRYVRIYIVGNIVLWCVYCLVFTLYPLVESARRYPYHLSLPIDSPAFECFYTVAVVGGTGCALIISTFDATLVTSFMCLVGYFQILQRKLEGGCEPTCKHTDLNGEGYRDGGGGRYGTVRGLRSRGSNARRAGNARAARVSVGCPSSSVAVNIGEAAGDNADDTHAVDMFERSRRHVEKERKRDHLFHCLGLHKYLIRLIDDIQHRAGIVLFIELVVGACMTCLTLFLAQQAPRGSLDMFVWAGYFLLVLQELYGICWVSSELSAESENVSDALYFSDWTEVPSSYRRSMLIMMSRAVTPIVISTGGFLNFNVEMFSAVYNSGYSCFNVMNQINSASVAKIKNG